MQVKEAIAELKKLDMEADICIHWKTKPKEVHVYTWGWICDNFKLEMFSEFDSIFSDTIQSLKQLYPYDIKVSSGDVVFVEKK
jgi:hypothetical protein